jgi:HPt (histidine-containing phosphotransfer) domain-containing protein
MGRAELLERVLQTFQRHFGHDLEQLEDDYRAANAVEVANVAHRMKGASANVSALELSRIASEIERLARLGNLNEMTPLLHDLRQEWTRFRESAGDVLSEASLSL